MFVDLILVIETIKKTQLNPDVVRCEILMQLDKIFSKHPVFNFDLLFATRTNLHCSLKNYVEAIALS